MDLERLFEFTVIAETGSFRKSAATLGIAPSVLSTRLQSLEKELGTSLFYRTSRRVELTENGRLLLQNADDLLSHWERTKEALHTAERSTFRSLRLQLCAQTMPSELGPFLDQYCRRHPQLFLDLYDENTCTIREGLLSGRTDIAFVIGRADDFRDIPGRIVLTHFPQLMVHVANDHRLATRGTIPFQSLAGETFILYPKMQEDCIRRLQMSILDQAGIPYRIYEEECSPRFFDLLIPIGKGIRLWNWSDMLAPNTTSLAINDEGYDTWFYMLFDPLTENATTLHFVERFLQFRNGRI